MTRFPAMGGGGSAYTYVQGTYPQEPAEGESLYHTGENKAYVYTGSTWVEQTVAAHADLTGVGASDHHAKTTDHAELSGIGASDHHSRPTSTGVEGGSGGWMSDDAAVGSLIDGLDNTGTSTSGTVTMADGTQHTVAAGDIVNIPPGILESTDYMNAAHVISMPNHSHDI